MRQVTFRVVQSLILPRPISFESNGSTVSPTGPCRLPPPPATLLLQSHHLPRSAARSCRPPSARAAPLPPRGHSPRGGTRVAIPHHGRSFPLRTSADRAEGRASSRKGGGHARGPPRHRPHDRGPRRHVRGGGAAAHIALHTAHAHART
eukprot:5067269-Prymnesium_polylepis.1